ncbi:hypothetical protein CRG98_034143 [Punica granatum]|uniref:Uncharacterized protein n=1 Tax=Punica granatum TaxID=22663 RepID=A0A2I0IN99_PUNGR|nr:hypothetical protein CRG98_034143 [Punica granatum]
MMCKFGGSHKVHEKRRSETKCVADAPISTTTTTYEVAGDIRVVGDLVSGDSGRNQGPHCLGSLFAHSFRSQRRLQQSPTTLFAMVVAEIKA